MFAAASADANLYHAPLTNLIHDKGIQQGGGQGMQESRYGVAKGLLILAYLCLGPIGCAVLAFDKPVIILVVGLAVGVFLGPVLHYLATSDHAETVPQQEVDTEAKIAVLVCAILFVALCVYAIYSSWYEYQSLRHIPIYGVGMIYAPSLVVGIAIFAGARYVSRRLTISGNR